MLHIDLLQSRQHGSLYPGYTDVNIFITGNQAEVDHVGWQPEMLRHCEIIYTGTQSDTASHGYTVEHMEGVKEVEVPSGALNMVQYG